MTAASNKLPPPFCEPMPSSHKYINMNQDPPLASEANEEKKSPRISVVLPYHAKMKEKSGLQDLLLKEADKAETELLCHFSKDEVGPLISKLRSLVPAVTCPAEGKSLAIFISDSAEKIYYYSPSRLDKYKLPVLVHRRDMQH